MDDDRQDDREHHTLRSLGLTLLGVVASISLTVGFGISADWWLRVAAAIATAVGLLTIIKVSTRSGAKGRIARIADWITGTES